jgi:hypothetical protein
MKAMKDALMKSNSENPEYCRGKFELKTENNRLEMENDRPDCLCLLD